MSSWVLMAEGAWMLELGGPASSGFPKIEIRLLDPATWLLAVDLSEHQATVRAASFVDYVSAQRAALKLALEILGPDREHQILELLAAST